MRIIGIDPGTATTGFGVIDIGPRSRRFVTAGVIKTESSKSAELRLHEIHSQIKRLIKEFRPEQMIIELLYFASNVTTAMSVSQGRGVVLLAAAQAKLPVIEYTPLQVKLALTGYGRAEKKDMQETVKKILKLDAIPRPDDAADALALVICHASGLVRRVGAQPASKTI